MSAWKTWRVFFKKDLVFMNASVIFSLDILLMGIRTPSPGSRIQRDRWSPIARSPNNERD